MSDDEAIATARRFHETYEELAPLFGYTTRHDTRQFDHESPNGRLMVAVVRKVVGDELDRLRVMRDFIVMFNRDNLGRVSIEWPDDGPRQVLMTYELLDQIIRDANARCWIPVEERLPELTEENGNDQYSEQVLVVLEDSDSPVSVGTYGTEHGWMVGYDVWEKVTHWMPLPLKPSELPWAASKNSAT